jgi:hypothetical protein
VPFIPGTGAPDGEPRALPHGEPLATASSTAVVSPGTVIDNAGDGWHVAAYRSLAVVCINNGANPINVTVRWAFWLQPTSLIYTEETKTVPALTRSRLLFQNQADFVSRVTFTGIGGSSAFNYYITGSNLDPLAVSRAPFLYLAGVDAGVQSVAGGVGFNAWFQQAGGVSYNSDPNVYSFNTISPGVTDTVILLAEGLYLCTAGFTYSGPTGAFYKHGSLVGHNIDTVAPLMSAQWDGFDPNEIWVAVADLFRCSSSSIGAGNNSIQVSGAHNAGGAQAIGSAYLHIAQLANVAP